MCEDPHLRRGAAVHALVVLVSAAAISPARAGGMASASQAGTGTPVTLAGCLLQERDVPSRNPEAIDHAGILEDFVLANAAPAAAKPGETGIIFKLEGRPAAEFERFLKRRVTIRGQTATPNVAPPRSADEPLPTLQVSSIDAQPGSCS